MKNKFTSVAILVAVGAFVGALVVALLSISGAGARIAEPGYFGYAPNKDKWDGEDDDEEGLDWG